MSNTTQNEFILVKDFSKLVNLSNQSIYLKIRTDPEFKERYVTEINGHMYIKSIALEKVYGVSPEPKEPEESKSQDNNYKTLLIETLQRANEALQKELEAKNLQIERLQQALLNQQSLMLIDRKADPVDTESVTADDSKTDNHVVSHDDSGSVDNTINQPTKRKSFFSRFLRS